MLSFTQWDLISPPRWVFLNNYKQLLQDRLFWKTVWNTFYFTALSVPLGCGLGLFIALILNQKLKGLKIFRTVYFMPVVTSIVAVAMVWTWIYDTDYGLLNAFLKILGFSPVHWLTSTKWAMPAIIIMSVWKGVGYSIVIFLAGLQEIPISLYEACEIDGATPWQKFRYVTFPMLSPTTFFVIIMNLIGSFQVFDQTYMMTKGGPDDSTLTIVYYLYQNAFKWSRMGYASGVAFFLFLIILGVTMVQMKMQKKWVHY